LPAQPRPRSEGAGRSVALAIVEAPKPPQPLGLDPVADALERDLIVAHRLRGHRLEVFGGQGIKERIDLAKGLSGGPIPPCPTHRTHVCSVAKICSVSSVYTRNFAPATTPRAPSLQAHPLLPLPSFFTARSGQPRLRPPPAVLFEITRGLVRLVTQKQEPPMLLGLVAQPRR